MQEPQQIIIDKIIAAVTLAFNNQAQPAALEKSLKADIKNLQRQTCQHALILFYAVTAADHYKIMNYDLMTAAELENNYEELEAQQGQAIPDEGAKMEIFSYDLVNNLIGYIE